MPAPSNSAAETTPSRAVVGSDACSAFDGVVREPIDRTAAMMLSKGVAPPEITITCDHWEVCPPLKKPAINGPDLSGHRQGRLVAVGMHKERQGRWVVRCDCGDFEIRTAKSLRNHANSADKCVKCRKIDQAKRHHEFVVNGRNFNSQNTTIEARRDSVASDEC
jgi:hypothetical protein